MEVTGTASRLCTVLGFGISGVKSSGSTIRYEVDGNIVHIFIQPLSEINLHHF
jgi:hypothetical protein